jgi:putative endonuclease
MSLWASINKRIVGNRYESAAADYLIAQGLTIVARNWTCRLGEIDLIAQHGECLVFVEVKQRSASANSNFGGAIASITPSKLGKVQRAASLYLATLNREVPCRIDVILIDGDKVTWLQDIG